MAFDLKELKERVMKKLGNQKSVVLNLVEEDLKIIFGEALDWAGENCLKSDKPALKIAGPLLPLVKAPIMDAIDKVDGEKG